MVDLCRRNLALVDQNKPLKVFITDANYSHTLGAIRILGIKGIYIIAGSSYKYAQGFYSKYCKERIIYPNPSNEGAFIQFILKYIKNNKIDVLLPISYLTTTTLSKYKAELCKYTKLPIADYESMEIASNKYKTLEMAKKLGIKIPKVYNHNENINNFPVVVKRVKEPSNIRYINSQEELEKINLQDCIIQEYIPGRGYGFYALFNHGAVRAIFMHKRIREYPITGGPSAVAESIYDNKLKDLGLKLLKELNWHGVAMVEFKKDIRDGEFKLMEINPKFWGSLDLSIAAGVNFPYLTIMMAQNGDVTPVLQYKVGIKFRWLLPDDVLHLLANPSSIDAFLHDFFDTKNNIWLNDIKPNLLQIFMTLRMVISYLKKKKLKYPHGIPKINFA